MITYPEGKQLILAWLQQRYIQKNQHDYVFKASYIARDMNISKQQIGHMLSLIEQDGPVVRIGKKTSPIRWRTQFNQIPLEKRSIFQRLFKRINRS